MKKQRWFERKDGMLYIYDEPYPNKAKLVAIVQESDLSYYRSIFNLRKVWSYEEEVPY